MKVKIISNTDKYGEIIERIKKEPLLQSNEDYDFVIIDSSYQKREIIGKNERNEFQIIKPTQIVYVESFGHEVLCHSQQGNLIIKEKLYEIEELFEKDGLIRVHKSFVINKNHVSTIKPTLNTKFILTMNNKDVIEVSRNYYNIFKNKIGL